MTSPAKFKKDKEIIAEYDTQVKGKEWFHFQPFIASLPGDCRSLQWMFGWGRGKSFADCLEFAGLFSAYKAGSGLQRCGAAPALVVLFLRYHSQGWFFFFILMEYPHF